MGLDVQTWTARHFHYDNTPMQYTAIFHGCKNLNFQMKKCDIFLFFAQNIDCRYMLNQSRTNGPINAHLTIAQVMLKYNHNNEKQEALSKYLQ